MNLGAIAIKRYPALPKAQALDCLVSYSRHSLEESYSSAKMQSVYSTAPVDWAILLLNRIIIFFFFLAHDPITY